MRILQVIHGYPLRYNAGSEVYTQTLCHGLSDRGHDVHVFAREEDPFAEDFRLRTELDPDDSRTTIHLVNHPRSRDRYREDGIDRRFAEVVDRFRPDVVHIGHLNHLSTSLVFEASARAIPVVYTLHDYWLMCPRGQFMQMRPDDPSDPWSVCDGQVDRKCAERCYARYFSGDMAERETDIAYWSAWIARRMRHIREVADHVDLFIAPSRYLLERHVREFGIPTSKIRYLDYGFDQSRFIGRTREPGEPFTFGYIGTHIAAKGVDRLIIAYASLQGERTLRIWGQSRGQETASLQALARSFPERVSSTVEWRGSYKNQDLVKTVFNSVDAIVVPSIWIENSPLVIHEAQQNGVPVVTADAGGMAEYVHHDVNGVVFRHRDSTSLGHQMQRLLDDPDFARRLGARGYLGSADGAVVSVEAHSAQIEATYEALLRRRDGCRVDVLPGPWRITLDTNPDTCNLQCVMCEEHSPLSDRQTVRRAAGSPPRIMPVALLRKVLAEGAANGLREVIPSTMGEPLLYEHFDEIVELCRLYKLTLNLTTNGTFPRRSARDWAELLVPVTSDIKISWNGATASTHEEIMIGARWDEVIGNVRELIAVRDAHAEAGGNRCRVTFQLTFLERNADELPEIVRLARSLGVDRVKGHHLWAHFDEIKAHSMRRDAGAIARWNRVVQRAREAAAEQALPNGSHVLLEGIFPLDVTAVEDLAPQGVCPFLGQEAWISAEGRFNPCCAPDAQRRTLGDFGSLHETGLMEIWRDEPYQRLVSGYRSRALCIGCNMRKPGAQE